jgi:predicted acyltransferase (DUF342 family)
MAQIIKHRRGLIGGVKNLTARNGELIIASGSITDLSGPFVFIGSPNVVDEGVAGAFNSVSKLYTGTAAPTITAATYGSALDGTPYYASGNKSLYILNNSNVGNTKIDLTGNIEGNTISNVTITSLTGSNANYTNLTGNTFTSTNGNITSLTGSNGNITNLTGTTITGSNVKVTNDLNVGGKIIATGDISGSNLNLTGNATIDGNIVLKGNISIGDQNTDFVTFAADVSSSITPDINNTFDLGSATKNWKDLYVSGTANVDILKARVVSFTDLSVAGNFSVTGSEYVNTNLFVGGNGKVTGSFEVVGATSLDSTLAVTGAATFKNNVNVFGDIATTGSANVNTNLFVGGNGKVTGSFEAVGAATLDSTLAVTGAVTLKNNLNVYGDVSTTGSEYVNTNLFVGGNGKVTGSFEVVGATNLDSTLIVTGSATFKNNVSISGSTSTTGSEFINQNLFVGGNGKVTGSFEVVGATSLDSTLIVTGSSTLKSTLEVQGITNLDSSLNVTGSVLMKDTLTVSGNTSVGGNINLTGNLYISGNLEIFNSASFVHISSSIIELDDNIIRLNAYSPFLRYAGFEVIDSGSSGVSASMVWDSQNDYWMFSSGSGQTSKIIGTTYGAYGSETSLTTNTIPKGTSASTVGDSLLTDNATTLSYNTNKFQVAASDGATLIAGNVTVSAAGGADAGTKTSRVVFRNSSNVLGYVPTTESTDVLDGILGYKNSDGALKFSTVIDGGTY